MSSAGLSSAAGMRNARYYINAFNEFENASGAWRPSWNWGALLCSAGCGRYARHTRKVTQSRSRSRSPAYCLRPIWPAA